MVNYIVYLFLIKHKPLFWKCKLLDEAEPSSKGDNISKTNEKLDLEKLTETESTGAEIVKNDLTEEILPHKISDCEQLNGVSNSDENDSKESCTIEETEINLNSEKVIDSPILLNQDTNDPTNITSNSTPEDLDNEVTAISSKKDEEISLFESLSDINEDLEDLLLNSSPIEDVSKLQAHLTEKNVVANNECLVTDVLKDEESTLRPISEIEKEIDDLILSTMSPKNVASSNEEDVEVELNLEDLLKTNAVIEKRTDSETITNSAEEEDIIILDEVEKSHVKEIIGK